MSEFTILSMLVGLLLSAMFGVKAGVQLGDSPGEWALSVPVAICVSSCFLVPAAMATLYLVRAISEVW